MNANRQWYTKHFNELSLDQLYDILKLRVDIFVVEQCCYYPELDDLDRDQATHHIFCYQDEQIIAYLRVLAKGVNDKNHPSIGRVAVIESERGSGLGHTLIEKGIADCKTRWPTLAIKISAQQHLENYYQQHGFQTISAMYLEDNIPHIAMLKPPE